MNKTVKDKGDIIIYQLSKKEVEVRVRSGLLTYKLLDYTGKSVQLLQNIFIRFLKTEKWIKKAMCIFCTLQILINL